MRKLTPYLIATLVTAWMAYLSWPVTAERPPVREKSGDVSRWILPFEANDYEASDPTPCPPSA